MALGERSLAGFLEVSLRATSLLGRTQPLVGAAALLDLPGSWRAGGAAFFFARRTPLDDLPFARAELQMGFAGALLEHPLGLIPGGEAASDPRLVLVARLLLGAGNAEVRDQVTRARVYSDNFLLVEPTLLLSVPLIHLLNGSALLGYRLAVGVDDLGQVNASDLRGFSFGLALGIGPL